MEPDLGALAAATVTDLEGRERRLGDAWAGGDRPALLTFLRHFG